MVVHRQCAFRKDGGQSCQAAPLREAEFCLMHSPEHAQEVAESRRLGGLRRRREVAVSGAYDFGGLDSVTSIRRLIEIAVLDTLGLENSVARSRTLAYLAQVALKSLETGELESRITMLEAAVQNKPRDGRNVFDAEQNFPTPQVSK